jgi:hypothetical protein
VVDPLQHVYLVQRCRICLEDADLNVNNEDGCGCRIEVTHIATIPAMKLRDLGEQMRALRRPAPG